jgi:hypothetical protein
MTEAPCYDIGREYHETIQSYAKDMAWYQLAVSKKYSNDFWTLLLITMNNKKCQVQ